MPRTMSTSCREALEKAVGADCFADIKASINDGAQGTSFGKGSRIRLAQVLGGVGIAADFETNCKGNTTISVASMRLQTALMNRLEHVLKCRDNAEDLIACINDGTMT